MRSFTQPTGYVSQLILGFGIGAGPFGRVGLPGSLNFARPANSDLIALLRRF